MNISTNRSYPHNFTPKQRAIFEEAQRLYRAKDEEGLVKLLERTLGRLGDLEALAEGIPGPTTDHTMSDLDSADDKGK